jgi:Arc/MetJ-type ribon-helix-helix transcriptional regulator
MSATKIAITLDAELLRKVDLLVAERRFPTRSRAIQEAVRAAVERPEHGRLERECVKLDPEFEQQLAELPVRGAKEKSMAQYTGHSARSRAKALRYYRAAIRFWRSASEVQRQRCLGNTAGSPVAPIDLSFYVVVIQRLREIARRAAENLGLKEAQEALRCFDTSWPRFEELRNNEEHFNRVPDWYYFADAVVDFQPPSKQYLVSAEHTQEALLQLAESLDRAIGLAIDDPHLNKRNRAGSRLDPRS